MRAVAGDAAAIAAVNVSRKKKRMTACMRTGRYKPQSYAPLSVHCPTRLQYCLSVSVHCTATRRLCSFSFASVAEKRARCTGNVSERCVRREDVISSCDRYRVTNDVVIDVVAMRRVESTQKARAYSPIREHIERT